MKTNYNDWRNDDDSLLATIGVAIAIGTLLMLAMFAFIFVSCEPSKEPANPTTDCNADSLTTVIDSLQIQVKAWENVVSLNHVNLERNQQSLHDLATEIEARDEQIAKYRNRLDSAAAIIKRQNEQLANSIYNKQKSQK